MEKPAPHTSSAIKLVIILIILAESAVLAYLYKKYHSQHLTTIALQDTLNRTMEAVHALQKDVAEKAQAVSDLERRFSEAGADGRPTKGGIAKEEQNAAYLRKRLKESKEMELQMYERIEELSRKQAEMESHAARPDITQATPTPVAIATATVAAQPTPTPTASATSTSPPQATATPVAQEAPPSETTAAEKAQPAGEIAGQIPIPNPKSKIPNPNIPQSGEIAGQILILNDTYNFIIISVGSDNGIEVGDEGIIEHDGTQMGRAKVKKLYNKMCLADIVETSPDAKIQKNYLVKFSREPENNVP